jgi:hypothetical protein
VLLGPFYRRSRRWRPGRGNGGARRAPWGAINGAPAACGHRGVAHEWRGGRQVTGGLGRAVSGAGRVVRLSGGGCGQQCRAWACTGGWSAAKAGRARGRRHGERAQGAGTVHAAVCAHGSSGQAGRQRRATQRHSSAVRVQVTGGTAGRAARGARAGRARGRGWSSTGAREGRGGVARDLGPGSAAVWCSGAEEGERRREGKGGGGKKEGRKGREKEKGRKRRNGGRRKGKREKGGDAHRRYSRRRPRLVGHTRATFARNTRRKRKLRRRRSRKGGRKWSTDHRAVRDGTATSEKRVLILQRGLGRQLESGIRMAANLGEDQGLGLNEL